MRVGNQNGFELVQISRSNHGFSHVLVDCVDVDIQLRKQKCLDCSRTRYERIDENRGVIIANLEAGGSEPSQSEAVGCIHRRRHCWLAGTGSAFPLPLENVCSSLCAITRNRVVNNLIWSDK